MLGPTGLSARGAHAGVTCGIYINIHIGTPRGVSAMVSGPNYIHIKCPSPEIKLKAHSLQSERARAFGLTPSTLQRHAFSRSWSRPKDALGPREQSATPGPEQVCLAPQQVSLGLEAPPSEQRAGKCSRPARIRSDSVPHPLPSCGPTVCCGQEVVTGHVGDKDTRNWTHMITSTLPFPCTPFGGKRKPSERFQRM